MSLLSLAHVPSTPAKLPATQARQEQLLVVFQIWLSQEIETVTIISLFALHVQKNHPVNIYYYLILNPLSGGLLGH